MRVPHRAEEPGAHVRPDRPDRHRRGARLARGQHGPRRDGARGVRPGGCRGEACFEYRRVIIPDPRSERQRDQGERGGVVLGRRARRLRRRSRRTVRRRRRGAWRRGGGPADADDGGGYHTVLSVARRPVANRGDQRPRHHDRGRHRRGEAPRMAREHRDGRRRRHGDGR